jgi:hypothetical protein
MDSRPSPSGSRIEARYLANSYSEDKMPMGLLPPTKDVSAPDQLPDLERVRSGVGERCVSSFIVVDSGGSAGGFLTKDATPEGY